MTDESTDLEVVALDKQDSVTTKDTACRFKIGVEEGDEDEFVEALNNRKVNDSSKLEASEETEEEDEFNLMTSTISTSTSMAPDEVLMLIPDALQHSSTELTLG